MLFNSLEYLIFLPVIFCLYWFVFYKSLKTQNLLLLISSYIFYGWWDFRFLSLIFLSTLIDYFVGLKIYNSQNNTVKKSYLWVSIFFNLSLLGTFKYFNFFIDSWFDLIGTFGYEYQSTWTLNVILPVGISFYTFQTISYSLDIYFKKLRPTKDFISFASFVCFFPQLVAGPIERASNLLPQILKNRVFKYEQGVQGLRLILWGMFKKVVIADSLGPRVDLIFENYQIYDGGILFLGLVYFSFQIYCDFSGYSDIAIGTAKLFGINLRKNFNLPYFSKNIKDFWKRWHISLSSWFRDYLYIPLGGSKEGKWLSLRNIFIVFIVSGFWHGANWTFIVWGLLHALLYTPFFLSSRRISVKKKRSIKKLRFPFLEKIIQIFITYLITTITWVFFRSENVFDAFNYLLIIFSQFSNPNQFRKEIVYVLIVIIIEIFIYLEISSIFKIRNKLFIYLIYSFLLYTIFEKIQLVHSMQFLYFSF